MPMMLSTYQLRLKFTVKNDVLTMLMTSLARDASALGSIKEEVSVGHSA